MTGDHGERRILVVGAGFAGSVCARQLAEAGFRVIVQESRDHVGGNAYDCLDGAGILIHPYGPHIFHTSNEETFDYLTRFTRWRAYEHRVLASVRGDLYPLPINRTTINRLYGLDLDEAGVSRFLERVREPRAQLRTSEDVVLSSVGRDLCDTFFSGYTRKQWGRSLSELAAGVAARIPTRTNDDDRYFTDRFQFMPADGYSRLFERLLSHPGIEVRLGSSYVGPGADDGCYLHTVYTGPLDGFYGFRLGRLAYRSVRFEHRHLPSTSRYQRVGTVNYPNDHEFTRITEFKHLTGQQIAGTSIVTEFPQAEGEPLYPVPRAGGDDLAERYRAMARNEPRVTFLGRLAQYKYLDMDQVVGAALVVSRKLIARLA